MDFLFSIHDAAIPAENMIGAGACCASAAAGAACAG